MTSPTLADAVAMHQQALKAAGRSTHTRRQYLVYHERFVAYLETRGIPPTLDALTPANVRAAVIHHLEQGPARKGANRTRDGEVAARAYIDLMKRLGSWCEEEGLVDVSPLRRLKRRQIAQHLREPFSEAELEALWAACRQTRWAARDEALFLMLLDTGLRIGEATSLTLDNLRLDQQRLIVGAKGKGRRDRIVPLGDRATTALRRYLASDEHPPDAVHVFVNRWGTPLTGSGGHDMMARLGKVAGVANCFPHRLRHTTATRYLTVHPGDEQGLRRLLGHISDDVLESYIHFADTTIAERAAAASLAENLPEPIARRRAYGHRTWKSA